MRSLKSLAMAVGVLVGASAAAASALAQDTSRVAGQWVLESGSPTPLCGRECTITQAGDVLTVQSARTFTFKLDGLPVTTTETSGGRSAEMTVTARLDGGRVIIQRKVGATESTTTLAMEGDKLAVSVEAQNPLGGNGKILYRRK